ncbi:hypothetical protein M513_07455, partial [Trichuris suis]
ANNQDCQIWSAKADSGPTMAKRPDSGRNCGKAKAQRGRRLRVFGCHHEANRFFWLDHWRCSANCDRCLL